MTRTTRRYRVAVLTSSNNDSPFEGKVLQVFIIKASDFIRARRPN
jgi:hypothetical protein